MPAILDFPTEQDVVDRFDFSARGWVWLEGDHSQIEAVELWSGTTLLGETPVLTARPDVVAALGLPATSSTGFEIHAHHPTHARGAKLDMQVRVRLRDGNRSDVLCARVVRSWGWDETVPVPSSTVCELPARPEYAEVAPLPPEHLQIRQVASVWGRHFYREGWVILRQLAALFSDAALPLSRAEAVLDFGCGCGRVLRGFETLPHTGQIWGCDIDAEAIAWNAEHHGHIAQFCANPIVPPTRFANGVFDAVYSVSVFTHLPEELQFAWLTELRRIVRPGGVLVASVHGGHYWSNADAGVRTEVANRGFAYRDGPLTAGLPDFYMVAYHSEAYVRAKWSRFFEVVAFREKYVHGVQDAVVLRRRDD